MFQTDLSLLAFRLTTLTLHAFASSAIILPSRGAPGIVVLSDGGGRERHLLHLLLLLFCNA